MVIDADCPHQSLQACRSAEDYVPDSGRMKRQTQTLSRGLAEITPTQVVQFIHQSVKDFFVEKGLSALAGNVTRRRNIDSEFGETWNGLNISRETDRINPSRCAADGYHPTLDGKATRSVFRRQPEHVLAIASNPGQILSQAIAMSLWIIRLN